ncbi:MAG: PP2C family protein-serine/threonine phosphatase [Acidobacteriia bacterium]|nr:PP2C family protein-serine/threonine phosphatase [Terriglobia bacterium]
MEPGRSTLQLPFGSASTGSVHLRSQAWSFLIVSSATVCVAYADYLVKSISLGYLYILPLSLSAILLSRGVSFALIGLCVFFHDLFGPPYPSIQARIAHNLTALVAFVFAVLLLQRFVAQRNSLFDLVRQQRDELVKEVGLAAQVQKLFLPTSSPAVPGFDIAAVMYPVGGVGGDYYDYIPFSNGSLGLVIADVSGKGVAAALLMSATAATIRFETSETHSLGDMVNRLNRELHALPSNSHFVTLLLGELDPRSRRLKCVNCGHNPALLLRAASGDASWLPSSCVPLGLFETVTCQPEVIDLEPGDVMVWYTDGLTEAVDAQGREFGRDGLLENVRNNRGMSAEEIVNGLYSAAIAFNRGETLADDLTIMVIRVDSIDPSPGDETKIL